MAVSEAKVGPAIMPIRRVILPDPVIHLDGKIAVFQGSAAFIQEYQGARRGRIDDIRIFPADGITRIDPVDVAIHLAGHGKTSNPLDLSPISLVVIGWTDIDVQ